MAPHQDAIVSAEDVTRKETRPAKDDGDRDSKSDADINADVEAGDDVEDEDEEEVDLETIDRIYRYLSLSTPFLAPI